MEQKAYQACTKCGITSEFVKFSSNRGWCNPCKAERAREYYKEKKYGVIKPDKRCANCGAQPPFAHFYNASCSNCSTCMANYQRERLKNPEAKTHHSEKCKATVERYRQSHPPDFKKRPITIYKICSSCFARTNDFGFNRCNKDGLTEHCRPCRREKQRKKNEN